MPKNWRNHAEQRSIYPESVYYKQIEVQTALYRLVAQSFSKVHESIVHPDR
jgi:hypothetical protein